jgi:hypothetical protein
VLKNEIQRIRRRERNHCAFLLQMVILIYFSESTSMISNANEQLLSLCNQTISSWLFLHLCYVWYLTIRLVFPLVMSLVVIGQYLWTWCRCDHRHIEDFSVYEQSYSRLDRFCRYILYEVRLMLTYVIIAFAWTWLMSNRSIHWFTISRWFIEASLIPFTLMTTVAVSLDFGYLHFFDFDLILISPFIYTMKGILFVLLRYAELHPSSRVNDHQIFVLYQFCNKSDLHHIPHQHGLRQLMYRLESSTQL